MTDIKHGTPNSYNKHKCRCDECRAAWRVYQSLVRARRKGLRLSADDPRHGRASSYMNWGCRCALCLAAYRIQTEDRTYGFDPGERAALWERQGRRCAACRRDAVEHSGRWHIDHDHSTGTVRGILCHGCNVALGMLGDELARVEGLALYMREFTA